LIVGSLFGIIIGKLVFGGTGRNVFNPAAAGFVFAKLVFGSRYAVANYPASAFGWSINTGATFLKGDYWSASAYSKGYSGLLDLLIGSVPGLMGETCKIAILLGLVYLLVRHTVDWRVVASFFGTFFFFMLFAGVIAHVLDGNVDILQFALYQLLSGGVLFGGVFMLTDPVTMPLSRPDRLLFGMMVAISTVFFRLFFVEEYTHEGMAFSILIVNAIVPLLDSHYWNTNVYAKKNWVALTALPLAMVGVMVLTLLAQKGFFTNGGVPSSSSSESTVSTGGTKNLMFLGGLFSFLR
jgi:Na+-translocating ferredoxin:NAD+ oxidoreductase subunit D